MNNFSVFSAIGVIMLIALVVYVAYVYTQRQQGNNRIRYSVSLIALLATAGILIAVFGSGLTFIPPQERALVLSALSVMSPQSIKVCLVGSDARSVFILASLNNTGVSFVSSFIARTNLSAGRRGNSSRR